MRLHFLFSAVMIVVIGIVFVNFRNINNKPKRLVNGLCHFNQCQLC